MNFKRVFLLGVPLDASGDAGDFGELLRSKGSPRTAAFVGPGAWRLAAKEPSYGDLLSKLSLVLPDGLGIALTARLLTGEMCHPVGFATAAASRPFFETMRKEKLSLGLIGGAPGVDEDVAAKLLSVHRDLKIVMTAHGYGDSAPKIEKLVSRAPDIVIVGMEAPRQESFILALRDAGYRGFAIACGDFFEHYMAAGSHAPCPHWIDRWHIGFLYRLYQEPHRLWRRYLIDYPLFYSLVLHDMLGKIIRKGETMIAKTSKNTQS